MRRRLRDDNHPPTIAGAYPESAAARNSRYASRRLFRLYSISPSRSLASASPNCAARSNKPHRRLPPRFVSSRSRTLHLPPRETATKSARDPRAFRRICTSPRGPAPPPPFVPTTCRMSATRAGTSQPVPLSPRPRDTTLARLRDPWRRQCHVRIACAVSLMAGTSPSSAARLYHRAASPGSVRVAAYSRIASGSAQLRRPPHPHRIRPAEHDYRCAVPCLSRALRFAGCARAPPHDSAQPPFDTTPARLAAYTATHTRTCRRHRQVRLRVASCGNRRGTRRAASSQEGIPRLPRAHTSA